MRGAGRQLYKTALSVVDTSRIRTITMEGIPPRGLSKRGDIGAARRRSPLTSARRLEIELKKGCAVFQ